MTTPEKIYKWENKKKLKPLIKALISGEEQIRQFAAEALGRIGDPRASEPLCKKMWIMK